MSNVNEDNEDIGNDLIQAAKKGDINGVRRLISEGANVNATDDSEDTALHFAAGNGHQEVVKALLDKGANVDVQNDKGETPLYLAAENGYKEVVEVLLKADGINVNAVDKDGKTPLDLTTNEEIKALLKKAAEDPDASSVDEPLTDSEGVQEEDAGTKKKEKQEGDAQPGSDIIGQDLDNTEPQDNGVNSVAPTQTEEQPSSFFGSLFSILMKPFSLIASFFGSFFSWLFGSNEEKIDESTSQTDASVSLPKLDSLDEKKIDAQPGNHSSLAPNQSAGQTDAPQLGADDNQLLG